MFSFLGVEINDELKQSRVPNAIVEGIHCVREIRGFLWQILKDDPVIDLIQKLQIQTNQLNNWEFPSQWTTFIGLLT